MTNAYIGIDPGDSSGAVAIITEKGVFIISKLSEMSDHDLSVVLETVTFNDAKCKPFGVLEKVHATPRQGVSSSFKFGVSYGRCRMALAAAGIPFEEVSPQKWQKALGLTTVVSAPIQNAKHKIKLSRDELKMDDLEMIRVISALNDPNITLRSHKRRIDEFITEQKKKLKNLQAAAKAQHKRDLKAKAQQLFPSVKVTLGNADALLLAEYCRRTRG